jgi:hypothetical protein
MRNKANLSKSQMFITVISTMNYNGKQTMDSWSKQTQTKPISTIFSIKKGPAIQQGPWFSHPFVVRKTL